MKYQSQSIHFHSRKCLRNGGHVASASRIISWRLHNMGTTSALLVFCEGICQLPVDFPYKGSTVTSSCGVFFLLVLTIWWRNSQVSGGLRHPDALMPMMSLCWLLNVSGVFCMIIKIYRLLKVINYLIGISKLVNNNHTISVLWNIAFYQMEVENTVKNSIYCTMMQKAMSS